MKINYPFPIKGGRITLPAVGEKVYVPAHGNPYLIGGLATVKSVAGEKPVHRDAVLTVEEHPDQEYRWGFLKQSQMELHERFQGVVARVPTQDEIDALATKARLAAEAVIVAERVKWNPQKFTCINGALLEVPAWEKHKRGRNWAAIIDVDPTGPNGLSRFWFNRGRGPCIYIIPDELELFDPVEFGADYVRGSGWKDPDRWYGVALAIAEDHLLLQPCPDAMSAVLLSKQKRAAKEKPVEEAHDVTRSA
jgi:hypothetical protein